MATALTHAFSRLWNDDPVIQAMERGDILWGDLLTSTPSHSAITIHSPSESITTTTTATATSIPSGHHDEEAGWITTTTKKHIPTSRSSHTTVTTVTTVTNVMSTDIKPEGGSKTLVLKNLPTDITYSMLLKLLHTTFDSFGPINDIRILKNNLPGPLYGTLRGFAYISFLHSSSALHAFSLHSSLVLHNRKIHIEFANNQR